MGKEIITKKQYIAIMTAFLLGSSLVTEVGREAKNDAWIAVIFAILLSIPAYFVYARIVSLFPGKGLFEILPVIFGKTAGIIMTLPFIWYAFHLGALVIRNFTEFIQILTLPETPQYALALFMIFLNIWAAKSGIETIGRWTTIVLPIIMATIFLTTLLVVPKMEPQNIKPVLYNGLKPVLIASFPALTLPFAETVLCTVLFNNVRDNDSPYKIFYWSLFIGGSVLLFITVGNILSLGEANTAVRYFSSYSAVRLISIGKFLERIEITVVFAFMVGGFVKTSICLLAACRGAAKVLKIDNYRQLVAPVGILMMLLSLVIYGSTMEMFEWAEKIYKYYAIPFQVVFPLMIWIAAEIKVRTNKS